MHTGTFINYFYFKDKTGHKKILNDSSHVRSTSVLKLDIIWVFRQSDVANKSILQTNAKETFSANAVLLE